MMKKGNRDGKAHLEIKAIHQILFIVNGKTSTRVS